MPVFLMKHLFLYSYSRQHMLFPVVIVNIIRKDRYMKKTITLLIIFSCSFIFGVLLGGCEIPDTVNAGAAFFNDKSSYRYGGDTIFLPLKSGTIDEGSGFCYFTEFVKVDDKTLWIQDHITNCGLSLTQEFNQDGTAKVYTGNIKDLVKE